MMQYLELTFGAILALHAIYAYAALQRGYSISIAALIFFVPIVGPLAYILYENGPDAYYRFKRVIRKINALFGARQAPFKELIRLQQKVRLHPTIENQHRLATIYIQMGQFDESIKLLDNVLSQKVFASDPYLLLDKAQAFFGMQDFEQARLTLDFLFAQNTTFVSVNAQLLMARTLSELGEWQQANREFERLENLHPGLEASFYYLQHLRKLKNESRANEVLKLMHNRFARLPQHHRTSQKAWLKQAQREQQ